MVGGEKRTHPTRPFRTNPPPNETYRNPTHCRTQLKNREDCLSKLEEALAQAAVVPKTRNMRTGLTEWEKENRLREKKRRAETKSARRQKHNYDD